MVTLFRNNIGGFIFETQLYNFYWVTMTISGRLLSSTTIVKRIRAENCDFLVHLR